MSRYVVPAVVLACVASATACMRPEINDRAVQWSTAIVEARLSRIGPKTEIGRMQERQGFAGVLGTAVTSYYQRIYDFQVTQSLDGPYKVGQRIPVVRLWARTVNPNLGCEQHLSKANVGGEFLLMVRPLAEFKAIVPNGIPKPQVEGGMYIVHLEAKDQLKPSAITDLKGRIAGVRAAEQQINDATVQRLIASVQKADSDERADPSIRALEHLGPKVLDAVRAAMSTSSDQAKISFQHVISDLTPPDPIAMLIAQAQQRPPPGED